MHAADVFLLGVVDQIVERRQVGFGEGDGEFADTGETEPEFCTQRVPQLVAPPFQAALERFGVGVVTTVDDAAVGLARSESRFDLTFEECHREFVPAEFVGDRRSHDAGPYHHDVLQRGGHGGATAPVWGRRGQPLHHR